MNMDSKDNQKPDRRTVLGGLAALAALPLVLGKKALGLLPHQAPHPSIQITPPDHSVKRRG